MADLKVGVIIGAGGDVRAEFAQVRDLGLGCCQLMVGGGPYGDDTVASVKAACKESGVEITEIWAGLPGPAVWDFLQGPTTIGLVPPEYREERVASLLMSADLTAQLGISAMITHAGFIPENPTDPLYPGTIDALSIVAKRCKELGLFFCFETGQETPTTVLRAMRDIGTGNLGINLDPANLLMYGKANPVDALDILGPYVKGVHAKDGEYPTEPDSLGVEKRLGEGRVDFPRFIAKLKSFGYHGALTIEREISGEEQIRDINQAVKFLEPFL